MGKTQAEIREEWKTLGYVAISQYMSEDVRDAVMAMLSLMRGLDMLQIATGDDHQKMLVLSQRYGRVHVVTSSLIHEKESADDPKIVKLLDGILEVIKIRKNWLWEGRRPEVLQADKFRAFAIEYALANVLRGQLRVLEILRVGGDVSMLNMEKVCNPLPEIELPNKVNGGTF